MIRGKLTLSAASAAFFFDSICSWMASLSSMFANLQWMPNSHNTSCCVARHQPTLHLHSRSFLTVIFTLP